MTEVRLPTFESQETETLSCEGITNLQLSHELVV